MLNRELRQYIKEMSNHIMRKPVLGIGENKGASQLRELIIPPAFMPTGI